MGYMAPETIMPPKTDKQSLQSMSDFALWDMLRGSGISGVSGSGGSINTMTREAQTLCAVDTYSFGILCWECTIIPGKGSVV